MEVTSEIHQSVRARSQGPIHPDSAICWPLPRGQVSPRGRCRGHNMYTEHTTYDPPPKHTTAIAEPQWPIIFRNIELNINKW